MARRITKATARKVLAKAKQELSCRQIAKDLHISRDSVYRIVAGKWHPPDNSHSGPTSAKGAYCPGCERNVPPPCVACRAKKFQRNRRPRNAILIDSLGHESDLALNLKKAEQKHYDKVAAERAAKPPPIPQQENDHPSLRAIHQTNFMR